MCQGDDLHLQKDKEERSLLSKNLTKEIIDNDEKYED